MMPKALITMALVFVSSHSLTAQTLVCDGVLGNSGEAGKTLVRFAPREASGLGVAVDRFGSLWDRAGVGTLNRYAPDGRLLSQYRIPPGAPSANGQDKITVVGDAVVLKLGDGLFTLPVEAPGGSEAKKLDIKVTRISSQNQGGWLAAANGPDVFLVQPTTGEKKPVATLESAVDTLEVGPDGAVYVAMKGTVRSLGVGVGNTNSQGNSKRLPGDRLQWMDGAWWAHAYHGTIFRYNAALDPEPGVVLGGASGTFIGHLDQNTELNNGRGLAVVRPGIYAISGWSGILHLLQWQDETRQFQIVRRIGAVPFCRGVGLDRAGNVWWYSGSWSWNDRPDAPLRFGVNAPENGLIAQPVMLPNNIMVAAGRVFGKPALYNGVLTKEVQTDLVTVDLGRDLMAAASYVGEKNERFLIAINAAGQGRRLKIDNQGQFRGDMGVFALQTLTPVKEWTSLTLKDDKTLWGAGDGHVIQLTRDGDNWKEATRWNSWGEQAGQKFGAKIWIATDAGRLWVADRDNNRVLCFDAATKQLLTSFGSEKGDDLTHLDAPETLAVSGERAIVFDSGNQRLMKLRWQK